MSSANKHEFVAGVQCTFHNRTLLYALLFILIAYMAYVDVLSNPRRPAYHHTDVYV